MRILYICGTYCPSYGGAEISMHTLLKEFQKNYNCNILVITDLRYTKNKKEFYYDTIKLIGISHENREFIIKEVISNFEPNIILTQLMWSDVALKLGKKYRIPTIFRACKIPFDLDLGRNSQYSPTGIISTSKAISNYIKENFNRECKIIYPAISFDKVLVKKEKFVIPYKREYITMFNPLKRKGGEVFKEIAKYLQNKSFATVHGWSCLKDNINAREFSDVLIKRICESLGTEYTGKKPKYIDLNDCKNIKIFKPTEEVWKIYAETRLLLIPSQWEEAFGRVAVEAMINRIPVIGSNVAGLKEAIGKGGILIKDYSNPKSWIIEIKKFDNLKYYNKISREGNGWVSNHYSLTSIVKESFNFFNQLIKASSNIPLLLKLLL